MSELRFLCLWTKEDAWWKLFGPSNYQKIQPCPTVHLPPPHPLFVRAELAVWLPNHALNAIGTCLQSHARDSLLESICARRSTCDVGAIQPETEPNETRKQQHHLVTPEVV